MVLIQLRLPASGPASTEGLAPLDQTRRELAEPFRQESTHLPALAVEPLDEGDR